MLGIAIFFFKSNVTSCMEIHYVDFLLLITFLNQVYILFKEELYIRKAYVLYIK